MNINVGDQDIFIGIMIFVAFSGLCLACALWHSRGTNPGRVERPKRWRDT